MASMVDSFETALLQHLFQNAALANVGDATGLPGSLTAGSTQLSLHTAALTDASTSLATNEVSYTGYSRPTQARSSAGWTVSGDTVSNAALIQFGQMTGGSAQTAVHLGLSFLATGNNLHLHQALQTSSNIAVNDNPQFAVGALDWVAA